MTPTLKSYLVTYDLDTPPGMHTQTRDYLVDNFGFQKQMVDGSGISKSLPNTTLYLPGSILTEREVATLVEKAAEMNRASPSNITVVKVDTKATYIWRKPLATLAALFGLRDRYRSGLPLDRYRRL